MKTISLLIQAIFDIRDALVGLHKLEQDRWVSEGRILAKKIEGDATDASRQADAASIADHLGKL